MRKYCLWLAELFNLGEYKLTVEFCDRIDLLRDWSKDDSCLASISADTVYLSMRVKISDFVWEMYKQEQWVELTDVLVHEFSHVLVHPIVDAYGGDDLTAAKQEAVEKTIERQTQRIGNVIKKLLPLELLQPGPECLLNEVEVEVEL